MVGDSTYFDIDLYLACNHDDPSQFTIEYEIEVDPLDKTRFLMLSVLCGQCGGPLKVASNHTPRTNMDSYDGDRIVSNLFGEDLVIPLSTFVLDELMTDPPAGSS